MNSQYVTTNELHYPGYQADISAEATRPMSSKGFTAPYDLSGPIGVTTCQEHYPWKTTVKMEPIRAGTSSGHRSNNPHPHEVSIVSRQL